MERCHFQTQSASRCLHSKTAWMVGSPRPLQRQPRSRKSSPWSTLLESLSTSPCQVIPFQMQPRMRSKRLSTLSTIWFPGTIKKWTFNILRGCPSQSTSKAINLDIFIAVLEARKRNGMSANFSFWPFLIP